MPEAAASVLPLLPLPGGVVVPQMVVNLILETEEARRAVAAAVADDGRIVLVPHVDGAYSRVGTVAVIEQVEPSAAAPQAVLLRGLHRATIGSGQVGDGSTLRVSVDPVDESGPYPAEVTALAKEYRAVVAELLEHRGARRVADQLPGADEPGVLADTALYSPELPLDLRLAVLEATDVADRLRLVLDWATERLDDHAVRSTVRKAAEERMEGRQREYLLREQLAAIRAELGEGDGDVADEYRARIAELDLPEEVHTAVSKELDRLERMGEQNPEHGWVRTWLDTVLDVPWNVRSDDTTDLTAARAVLDADHTGLDEVKERIVEFLAVRNLRAERGVQTVRRGAGAILALAGPPGVGKTSLGESIASALGREFVRVALGGIRDEAEIRGHRRTYVGAQPGRLVRALREAGTMNPVILLDEIDKVAADWRGDPTAALLEVLDPAQNHTFRDHYLEVDLDLSDVLFVATANVLDTIPGPLLDRLEIIRLDGYTDEEKRGIARAHLLPKLVESSGLRPEELALTDAALDAVIDGYTREAGVRGLERALGKIVRKVAARVATAPDEANIVDVDDVRELLGRPVVRHDEAARAGVPGVVTGLAVTGAGGDVLVIEASVSDGDPGLTLTGQLGDVMQESARIALSYVKSHVAELGIPAGALDGRRVHLHVPAGAVPKDGPSAGITMVSALVSLLTGRAPEPRVGMTGEVTLQGRVLPIGGVKQKLLAAHRAGITDVVIPVDNADDLEDVPETVRAALRVHPADTVADVLAVVLPMAPTEEAAEAP
jgi:ATP-dependent Lon protease